MAAEHHNHVHLTGWVEDIRPHLGGGAVCVVPLRIGSGTRLKIFEAMAMAKAIVSTTIGAEGLLPLLSAAFRKDGEERYSRVWPVGVVAPFTVL